MKEQWCIAEVSSEFVSRMEDVLTLYEQPHDPARPVVCFDWLNMVEIELSVLEQQCLARRIGSREELEQETAAWETARNACHATVNWRFTTEKARQKLHWLYQPKQS